MRITEIGKDLIVITETDLEHLPEYTHKVHLVKFKFEDPSETKIHKVLSHFDSTNRFIVGDNIKLYNEVLKRTSKKYYVQNKVDQVGIISFFRKNNKVLLSVPSLSPEERTFVLAVALGDILRNLEVIMIERSDYMTHIDQFKNWKGNVVLFDPSIHLDIL